MVNYNFQAYKLASSNSEMSALNYVGFYETVRRALDDDITPLFEDVHFTRQETFEEPSKSEGDRISAAEWNETIESLSSALGEMANYIESESRMSYMTDYLETIQNYYGKSKESVITTDDWNSLVQVIQSACTTLQNEMEDQYNYKHAWKFGDAMPMRLV